jgi:hypothetical protein
LYAIQFRDEFSGGVAAGEKSDGDKKEKVLHVLIDFIGSKVRRLF